MLVYQGELEIVLRGKADERYAIPAGSVISYRADQPHIYRNLADGVTRAAMVITTPRRRRRRKPHKENAPGSPGAFSVFKPDGAGKTAPADAGAVF